MTGGAAQAVKEKLDIVEFLKGYLQVQPAGRNFKANCPFHKEKTPSFMISPERQSWHCFGCGIGGDVFAFAMRHDNLEFGEALKILADKAGVQLKQQSPMEYQSYGLLYDLNEIAKDFFVKELKASKQAQEYLVSRGLSQEILDEFEVGWASTQSEALNLHFLNLGYNPADVVRAGLAIKTERGMQFDRFRGRIMFPIHNHLGKVVGFTGRILPILDKGDMGKYVNSPETAIFNKSKLLYGFWRSKNSIREMGSAFLVEGQMDFLMSYQAGVKNVVASSGTALTSDHLFSLKRVTDRLILGLDNDEAGWNACERAIDLAEQNDFNVTIATLGEFKDPAEAAQKDPEKLKGALSEAKPATKIYFERYLPHQTYNFSERENLRNLRVVLSKIQNIVSPVERDFWMQSLSRYVGLSEKVIKEEAENLPQKQQPLAQNQEEVQNNKPKEKSSSRRDLLSRDLLSATLALNDFSLIADYEQYLIEPCREIYKILSAGGKSTADPELDSLMNAIVLKSDSMPVPELQDLKEFLKTEYVKERRLELAARVRRAEAEGKEEEVLSALQELNQLPIS